MNLPHALIFLLAAFLAGTPPAFAADDGIVTRPVRFSKGASAATIHGALKGRQTIDYVLRAKAGQAMKVELKTPNDALYFNVLPPGSNDVAIHNGSVGGNDWSGALPQDGEYKVRVYLMRSAGRRGESAPFTLTIGLSGTPAAAGLGKAPASDAKVKGTPFHATGNVPCVVGDASAALQPCPFGVIRGSAGNAEVHVTPPGGLKRVLRFASAKVTSEGAQGVKATKTGDEWSVEVNDVERYRIPEAVITGG